VNIKGVMRMPTTQPSQFSNARLLGAAAFVLVLTLAYRPAAALGGCNVFPPDNIWNTPIDTLDRDPLSDAYIDTQGGVDVPCGLQDRVSGRAVGIPRRRAGESAAGADHPHLTATKRTRLSCSAERAGRGRRRRRSGDRHVLSCSRARAALYEMSARSAEAAPRSAASVRSST
jgi:hypothetical protein